MAILKNSLLRSQHTKNAELYRNDINNTVIANALTKIRL